MSTAPERQMTAPDTGPGETRLKVSGMSKTFGRQRVLSEVDLVVRPGELHGLVGQNGSGKSTLVKILTGIYTADPGVSIEVDGEDLGHPVRVPAMRAAGVSVVHQTLGLIDDATVLENVRAGRFRAGRWLRRIDWQAERAEVESVLERLGAHVDLRARAGDLSAEDRATVAIARALQDHEPGRGLIIFDESTRALTADSLARFYKQMETVRRQGAAILLISHRLEEVLEVADCVTVLRDGVVTAMGKPCAELDESSLVRLMIGRELRVLQRRPVTTQHGGAKLADEHIAARVRGLQGELVSDVSFAVRRGEVIGFTGLIGSGFEELPYLLSGANRARGGELRIGAKRIYQLHELSNPLRTLRHAGVALLPERRAEEGLALDLSVQENLTLPQIRDRGSKFWTGEGWQRQQTLTMMSRLDIQPRKPEAPVSTYSGGNQQKVLLAKWLACEPRVLLLHEPTQAVDVAARADIIEAIREAAAEGCAVVVAGTDPQELVALCDRVVVLRDGIVATELTGEFDEDAIVHATFTGSRDQGSSTNTSSSSIFTA